jgi:hypothetical protein
MGRGFPIVGANKQRINTRSSTETEIVGANNFMPSTCWTRLFMEAQGYKVKDNILFQDNKSSILLKKNEKASSSKRTKHINIQHCFIVNRVASGDLSIVWCPTGDMIITRCSVPEVQRPNHGRGSSARSGTGKIEASKQQIEEEQARERQANERQK